jgi:hypothetical protein
VGRRRASDRLETHPAQVWWFDVQRPLAPVQHRYAWRYLVGFVHPASGGTIFHLASTVGIPLFEGERAEFARQVDASPTKQIVLVRDRVGWHSSVRLSVPDHVHLLFLPAYSPELQLSISGRSPTRRSPTAISPPVTCSTTSRPNAECHFRRVVNWSAPPHSSPGGHATSRNDKDLG